MQHIPHEPVSRSIWLAAQREDEPASGVLERCKTLPNDTDLRTVADMRFDYTVNLQQNLRALERLGTEPELAQALAEAIDKCHPSWAELEHLRAKLATLNARYSDRRHKLADTIVDGALKVVGRIGQLVRRKSVVIHVRLTGRFMSVLGVS